MNLIWNVRTNCGGTIPASNEHIQSVSVEHTCHQARFGSGIAKSVNIKAGLALACLDQVSVTLHCVRQNIQQ